MTLQPTKVLITVMTYPHPSERHKELMCTAGVTAEGDWVRLYPVDYRYRATRQRFSKYQWVEVELEPRGAGNDKRKESRKPNLDTLRLVGAPLDVKNKWRARREIIDRLPVHTVKQLKALYETDGTSLGIVRPSRVLDLKIAKAGSEWKPKWQRIFDQLPLFEPPPKPLRKLPFKFSYVFECEDSDKPHNAMIEDWELGVLWLKECDRLGDEKKAAESVRKKYLDDMCRDDKDTRFFMGTRFPYNAWLVLGVFWPPEQRQTSLF